MNALHKIFIISTCCLFFLSCDKFLEVDPPKTSLVPGTLFADDNAATGAVSGIYLKLRTDTRIGSLRLTILPGFCADELTYSGATYDEFINNRISVDNSPVVQAWTGAYDIIYQSNACLEGLQQSTGLSAPVKTQLMGEVYFLRAFIYFYLVNLFGDVPIVTGTDYELNALEPRSPIQAVMAQIADDCRQAKNLLPAAYISSERIRPNKFAAAALLARVHLYSGRWADAESEASDVITSGLYTPLTTVEGVFLKASKETIWQLSSQTLTAANNMNTFEGNHFIPPNAASIPLYTLTNNLVDAFETGDARKTNWIQHNLIGGTAYHYPFKYKVRTNTVNTEYPVLLRAAEQYLIRAEARARQGKTEDAVEDINVIRTRASLPELSSFIDNNTCLLAIEKERRFEFFAEMGHRWFDLKRTNRADEVLSSVKPHWQPTAALWPIPRNEIVLNPKLSQNAGYQ